VLEIHIPGCTGEGINMTTDPILLGQSGLTAIDYMTEESTSLGTRPFAVEEGSGHVPTFELSLRNAIMHGN